MPILCVMICHAVYEPEHLMVPLLQSSESGGHGASPASLLSFIPELVDHVEKLCQKLSIQPTVPVVAAGGITDARQVELCL